MKDTALRNRDEFRVAAVAMFPDHFGPRTELFVAGPAKITLSAGDEVMKTDAIAGREMPHVAASFFHDTRNFMPQGERQVWDVGNPGAIVRIGMANAGSLDADQDIARSDERQLNFRFCQERTDCS